MGTDDPKYSNEFRDDVLRVLTGEVARELQPVKVDATDVGGEHGETSTGELGSLLLPLLLPLLLLLLLLLIFFDTPTAGKSLVVAVKLCDNKGEHWAMLVADVESIEVLEEVEDDKGDTGDNSLGGKHGVDALDFALPDI